MLNIAICEDDKKDTEELSGFVHLFFQSVEEPYQLCLFQSGEEFLTSKFIPDILFLDIIMEKKDGIQVGMELKKQYPDTLIIYTTNLKEKVMVAFNQLHAFGYLVKPIQQSDLESILTDAREKIESRQEAEKEYVTFLSEKNTIIRLPVSDIYYFEYLERRIRIVTENEIYICKEKIGDIAKKMEKYGFAMSHQSFVVNLYHVDFLKDQSVIMKNGASVFLAQKRASSLRKKLIQEVGKLG